MKEAKGQAVTQLEDTSIDKSKLSPEEAKQWKHATSADIENNIRIAYNHKLLHVWFENAEIPYVMLKGSASASYYPIYRSMGDVDFLVKREDLERAGKVTEKYGLKPLDGEHITGI